ncbi:MAG: NmrA family NAD(P)-binding protein [Ignavibacteriae bacterium]|nr:NmrA family NAD(P)-binding protein [Ignavibacteriota bacterium]
MSEKILIIGSTGSVGFEVATKLLHLKLPIKIAVRNPERAKTINLIDAEFVYFEYNKPETFKSAFEDVTKLLVVSPPSYIGIQDNVVNVINSAIENGVKLIVNVSAISAESELDKPIKKIEDHIINSGVDYVILRPNCYMQNFKDLFRDFISQENIITVPANDAKTSFVDIRDVADVSVKALTNDSLKNKVYKLTGKQLLNMHVVAHMFSEGLNREINYQNISKEQFEKILKSAGWPLSTITGTVQLCSHVKNGGTAVVSDDIKKILGRDPIKFEQFIRDYAEIWT